MTAVFAAQRARMVAPVTRSSRRLECPPHTPNVCPRPQSGWQTQTERSTSSAPCGAHVATTSTSGKQVGACSACALCSCMEGANWSCRLIHSVTCRLGDGAAAGSNLGAET